MPGLEHGLGTNVCPGEVDARPIPNDRRPVSERSLTGAQVPKLENSSVFSSTRDFANLRIASAPGGADQRAGHGVSGTQGCDHASGAQRTGKQRHAGNRIGIVARQPQVMGALRTQKRETPRAPVIDSFDVRPEARHPSRVLTARGQSSPEHGSGQNDGRCQELTELELLDEINRT